MKVECLVVQGLRVLGVGCMVQGLGFRVLGLGVEVWGLGFGVGDWGLCGARAIRV